MDLSRLLAALLPAKKAPAPTPRSRRLRRPPPPPLDLRAPLAAAIQQATRAGVPEADARTRLLDSFLACPHGDLRTYGPIHLEALARDPILYGHLARWYFDTGAVRDHQELFVAHLLVSPFPEHRVHGRVLMQRLRVYQVVRVVRYSKEVLHRPTRALRVAVAEYLRRREGHAAWFDECVIRNHRGVKFLYAATHVKPSPRAEGIVFADRVPADSRVAVARRLGHLREQPEQQAELILRYRIHYTTALGSVKHWTPSVVHAMASVMTPSQAVNSLRLLEKHGALAHPPTRPLIDRALAAAVQEGRVSDLKARMALQHVSADAKLAEDLLRVTHERLRNRGRIDVPTALLVDKSGSMEAAIEAGKLLACLCSTLADAPPHVTAFDSNAFRIQPRGTDYASWERARKRPWRSSTRDGGAPSPSPPRILRFARQWAA